MHDIVYSAGARSHGKVSIGGGMRMCACLCLSCVQAMNKCGRHSRGLYRHRDMLGIIMCEGDVGVHGILHAAQGRVGHR